MYVRVVIWTVLLQAVCAQAPAPYLTPSSVVLALPAAMQPLNAGVLVTIYGRNLGPDPACSADPGAGPEPRELCDTAVTVNGERAALLYVQERQINLRLPAGASIEETLQFVVTYHGLSSPAVPALLRRTDESSARRTGTARIKLLGRAYVHMPICIAVDLPAPHQWTVRYPVTTYPADLGGHDFEVLHGRATLPKIYSTAPVPRTGFGPVSPGSIGGGSLLGLPHEPRAVGRLPLHLLYRFDQSGQYQVRYTGYDLGGAALVRSDWLTIQVEAYPEQRRLEWLQDLGRTAPADSVDLLSEYLPNLLAKPDATTLAMLDPWLYHPVELVRQYALYALFSFDDGDITRWLPSVLRRRGPTPELALFLSWRRSLFLPWSNQLLRDVSAHLDSKSALVVAGALQSLGFMTLNGGRETAPAAMAVMDAVVASHADSIAKRTEPDLLQSLALYLGTVKTAASRRKL